MYQLLANLFPRWKNLDRFFEVAMIQGIKGSPQPRWPLTEGESNRIQFSRRLTGYGTTSPQEDRSLSSSPLLPKRLAIFIPPSSFRATTRDGHSADPLDNGGAEVSTTPRGRRTTIIIPDNPKRQSLLPKQHWKEYRKEYRNCFLSEPTPNRLWTELSLSLSIEFLCLSSWKR